MKKRSGEKKSISTQFSTPELLLQAKQGKLTYVVELSSISQFECLTRQAVEIDSSTVEKNTYTTLPIYIRFN